MTGYFAAVWKTEKEHIRKPSVCLPLLWLNRLKMICYYLCRSLNNLATAYVNKYKFLTGTFCKVYQKMNRVDNKNNKSAVWIAKRMNKKMLMMFTCFHMQLPFIIPFFFHLADRFSNINVPKSTTVWSINPVKLTFAEACNLFWNLNYLWS